jgi:hypothetical protein
MGFGDYEKGEQLYSVDEWLEALDRIIKNL